jgi:hypothetical protein
MHCRRNGLPAEILPNQSLVHEIPVVPTPPYPFYSSIRCSVHWPALSSHLRSTQNSCLPVRVCLFKADRRNAQADVKSL